jgi:hypothetical protein
MKKFGLLCLALVLALGALGVGYAAWTDTIFVSGTVSTGSVCLNIEDGTYGALNTCPESVNHPGVSGDINWDGWVKQVGNISCPMGYKFNTKPCTDKDVAWTTFSPVLDDKGNIVELQVTVHNAYPHFLSHISFEVCNCGTVPVKIEAPVFNQNPFLLIEYRNGVGEQLEPGACHEISLFVGVVQHQGYWSGDTWVVDDPTQPLLPQDNTTDLTFTITVTAIQWDQYSD